jgi:hypothetical protein
MRVPDLFDARAVPFVLLSVTRVGAIRQPRLPLPPRAEAAAPMAGVNGDIPFSGEA